MAGGGGSFVPARGDKKPLDTVINLVPFIDLMAVIIAFLIMTAVWTQVGTIELRPDDTSFWPNERDQTLPLNLLITEHELKLTLGPTDYDAIPISPAQLDLGTLEAQLKEIKKILPDQRAITLEPEDAVKYDILVRIMDICVGVGLKAISVSPTYKTVRQVH